MIERLFDERDYWTPAANDIEREMGNALKKIMKFWADNGYSIRDLALIGHNAVMMTECNLMIDKKLGEENEETDEVGEQQQL